MVWKYVGIDEDALGDEPDQLIVDVRNKVSELREAEVAKIEEAREGKDEPEEGWPEID